MFEQEHQTTGSVIACGFVSIRGKCNLLSYEGTVIAEKFIKISEQHMLPSRQHLFQKSASIFQQDFAKPHSAHCEEMAEEEDGAATGLTCLQSSLVCNRECAENF